MKINEAWWERVLRTIVGLFLISLTFWGPHSAWGWIGLIPLLTGIFGYCPIYALLGTSTYKAKSTVDELPVEVEEKQKQELGQEQ